jgi:hypothetical protein
MSDTFSINFGEPVPLFPLPDCVLLPHATIQLHIYEPRYRQMTADALGGRSLIAMSLFEGDSWKENYLESPPLRPFVCVSMINRHEKLPDGRYNLQLQGLCRAQMIEEVDSDRLYRQAIVQPTEIPAMMEIDMQDTRMRIVKLLNDPLLSTVATINALSNYLCDEMPTTALLDLAAMTCAGTMEERYEALCETDPLARGRWVEQLLYRIGRSIEIAQRFMPAGDSDHYLSN